MLSLRIIGQDPVVPVSLAPATPAGAWLAYGFRPFFLAAASAAVILMLIWLGILAGWTGFPPQLDPIRWHAHEMLFGFGGAVVAGFLLTAVPNWTGLPTPKGAPLGALLSLWLLGRVGSWWGGGLGFLDLLFLPALGTALAGPLWRAGQQRNLIFLPILGLLWFSDALFWTGFSSATTLGYAVYGLLLLIAVVAGRVVPFFTEKALPGHQARRWPVLEGLCLLGMFACALAENWPGIKPQLKLVLLLATAGLHALRLLGWGSWRIIQRPLLWVLYLSYVFLPVGLCLRGLAWCGWGSLSAATHALTAGCIAMMCLGMMARVGLGHTGRELKPAPVTVVAFVVMAGAALCRSLIPFFWPEFYAHALWCAGGLWCLAFSLFLIAYWPVLTRPRVDGKPG